MSLSNTTENAALKMFLQGAGLLSVTEDEAL